MRGKSHQHQHHDQYRSCQPVFLHRRNRTIALELSQLLYQTNIIQSLLFAPSCQFWWPWLNVTLSFTWLKVTHSDLLCHANYVTHIHKCTRAHTHTHTRHHRYICTLTHTHAHTPAHPHTQTYICTSLLIPSSPETSVPAIGTISSPPLPPVSQLEFHFLPVAVNFLETTYIW